MIWFYLLLGNFTIINKIFAYSSHVCLWKFFTRRNIIPGNYVVLCTYTSCFEMLDNFKLTCTYREIFADIIVFSNNIVQQLSYFVLRLLGYVLY